MGNKMEDVKESIIQQTKGLTLGEQLWLPKLLSDGCVLQQGEGTRVWGKTLPYMGVTAELGAARGGLDSKFPNIVSSTRSDSKGDWQILFPELKPGGPFSLTVRTESGGFRRVEDVYVGEVFVCAGQSNMELPMERVRDRYPEEFERLEEPLIRLYKVREQYDFNGPLMDHEKAEWKGCSKESIGGFSAVSYFFGRYLLEDRKVPVGLINLSLGGTPAEAWMGREALLSYPEAIETLEKYRDSDFVREQIQRNERLQKEWHDRIDEEDSGFKNLEKPWKEIQLPGFLEDAGLGNFCGSIWLKKKFQVPETMAKKAAKLWLGTLVDSDRTYVNGMLVGETFYQYPPRKYQIPEGLLNCGENEIVIRLVCDNGKGRMTPGKIYAVFTETERISLEGVWEYQVGFPCGPAPQTDFVSGKPTGLFNAMVAPCLPYTVKGVLWYQGESNDKNPYAYKDLLQRLILYWREVWKQERLPFVVAQLPGFSIDLKKDSQAWPMIRDAQAQAARIPDVAVTVNLDLGEWNDLHPLNKKEVARRMALAARGMIYGEPVVYKGPGLRGWKVTGNRVELFFDAGEGKKIRVKDGAGAEAFQLAGDDGVFYRADGQVKDNQVSVWCKELEKPMYLRYGYENAPQKGLLLNEEGLLASPFCLKLEGGEGLV